MQGRRGLSLAGAAWMMTCPMGLPSTPAKVRGTSKPFHSKKKSCCGPTHNGREVGIGDGVHAMGSPARVTTRVGQGTAKPSCCDAVWHCAVSAADAGTRRTVMGGWPAVAAVALVEVGAEAPLVPPPLEHAPRSTARSARTHTFMRARMPGPASYGERAERQIWRGPWRCPAAWGGRRARVRDEASSLGVRSACPFANEQ
jgi:hypothetical protein